MTTPSLRVRNCADTLRRPASRNPWSFRWNAIQANVRRAIAALRVAFNARCNGSVALFLTGAARVTELT
jgi:hypothetical protein